MNGNENIAAGLPEVHPHEYDSQKYSCLFCRKKSSSDPFAEPDGSVTCVFVNELRCRGPSESLSLFPLHTASTPSLICKPSWIDHKPHLHYLWIVYNNLWDGSFKFDTIRNDDESSYFTYFSILMQLALKVASPNALKPSAFQRPPIVLEPMVQVSVNSATKETHRTLCQPILLVPYAPAIRMYPPRIVESMNRRIEVTKNRKFEESWYRGIKEWKTLEGFDIRLLHSDTSLGCVHILIMSYMFDADHCMLNGKES